MLRKTFSFRDGKFNKFFSEINLFSNNKTIYLTELIELILASEDEHKTAKVADHLGFICHATLLK